MIIEEDKRAIAHRIIVLGGGFAGVEAARHLDRSVAKRGDVEVILVSRENFSLFTPMLQS